MMKQYHPRILNDLYIIKTILRHKHDTGTAQVKTWYSLDKINSYTTNTVVIRNENNLLLRINVTCVIPAAESLQSVDSVSYSSSISKKEIHTAIQTLNYK